MRLAFFAFIAVVLLSACNKENPTHLSPDKMQKLLLDIHLAEAYSTFTPAEERSPFTDRNMDSLAFFYHSIFTHYDIDAEKFEQSLSWYKAHPDQLDSIYAAMIPQLTKLEDVYPYGSMKLR